MRTVVGVFPSMTEANLVAHDLNAIGIPADEVSIADGASASSHEWSQRNVAAMGGAAFGWFLAALIPVVAERGRSAATGFGASVGAVAGLVAGMAALAVRAGEPIIAGSAIVTVLVALAIGATAGGLIAGMYSLGVSHEGIPLSDEAVREHGVVVAAHVFEAREPDALRIMKEHGARKARGGNDAWSASGWTGAHGIEKPYPSDSSVRSHEPGN